MSHRIFLAIPDVQWEALQKMMKDDLSTNLTAFVGYLIAQEMKNRTPKPIGRPKTKKDDDEEENEQDDDYTNDLPKSIPYFGQMIGPRESADKRALQDAFSSNKN